MAWNEPGRGGKDPWGGKNDQKDQKKGPPNIDELLRRFRKRLGGFGRGGGKPGWHSIGIAVGVLLAVWLASGFYQVDSAERGLVLEFGAYRESVSSGLHWHLPYPLGGVIKVNVDQVHNVSNRGLRLTEDENLVRVDVNAEYQVNDAKDYAFNVREPDDTLRDVLQSAIDHVIGRKALSVLLASSHGGVAEDIQAQVQKRLDAYAAGLRVNSVSIESISPPDALQDAFADADKAKQDMAQMKNQAQAYADRVVPAARGEIAQRLAAAEADKTREINQAKGETARFLALLAAYRKAPDITRTRLYLDAMGDVLAHSAKVVVRSGETGPILSLPLSDLTQAGKMPASGGQQSGKPSKRTPGSKGQQAKGSSAHNGNNDNGMSDDQARDRTRRQR